MSAALLNGVLVLFVPLFLEVWPYVFDGDSNASVTVRASGASVMGPILIL